MLVSLRLDEVIEALLIKTAKNALHHKIKCIEIIHSGVLY